MGFMSELFGFKARENEYYEKRTVARGRHDVDRNKRKAQECYDLAQEALANGDSRTAQKLAAEGSEAITLAADIQIAVLFDKW
jgi:hypothetical protein